MATWKIQDGDAVRVDAADSMHCAKYDLTGAVRIWTGSDRLTTPTADELAAWDSEAPARAAELIAARDARNAAARIEQQATAGAIKARFGGTCAITGRAYGRNALIRKTASGWAIADTVTLAAPAPVSSPLGGEFDADERDAYREDLRIAAAEMAMG